MSTREAVEDGDGGGDGGRGGEKRREGYKKNVTPGLITEVFCCRECCRGEGNDLGCSRSGWRHCGAPGLFTVAAQVIFQACCASCPPPLSMECRGFIIFFYEF